MRLAAPFYLMIIKHILTAQNFRLAKEEGWRARSAFKLMQINDEFDIFKVSNLGLFSSN